MLAEKEKSCGRTILLSVRYVCWCLYQISCRKCYKFTYFSWILTLRLGYQLRKVWGTTQMAVALHWTRRGPKDFSLLRTETAGTTSGEACQVRWKSPLDMACHAKRNNWEKKKLAVIFSINCIYNLRQAASTLGLFLVFFSNFKNKKYVANGEIPI